MPLYEHVFIARQDISSAQVEGLVETFSGLIQKDGGKIIDVEHWGLKNLAYRIKKNRKGHYVMLNIDSPVAAINELERNERLNEDVLRYLTLRVDELEEGPSVMTRGRKDNTGRDREDSYSIPNDSDREEPITNDKDREIVSDYETKSEELSQ
ncbi:MAG: 30S ribosomal protein S6 [Rhodospirillaceae bacterium]|nr:30S ribosomal protein S6 [Rhodospirillaceae bacterium]|tara:strand:- start:14096 stop:14554 length:459 start_codon:yes stop_codon:yes gene_type:complete